jgi:glycosyltransferase involved in cell wall biosynthesis
MLPAGVDLGSAGSKFRIALFHPCLVPGGIPRVFVNLARGFLEQGFAVDLVQATRGSGFRHAVPEGVRLIDLNARRALTSLPPLIRYFHRERPRVVIAGAVQTNLVAAWARRIAGVPQQLILTEHNVISAISNGAPLARTRMTPSLVRRFYPWADELVAVSQGVALDLKHILGNRAEKIHIVYNPILGPEFWQCASEPLPNSAIGTDPRPIVLAVGRLHYHKDYPTLLRAFAIVRRSVDARLLFLGDGPERGALAARTREFQIERAVEFLSEVRNPLPFLKRAKVLALSSIVEALPTVLIEALALNLPVVATDCPSGPREILNHGAYGTLVPVGNSERLAEALLDVLRNPHRKEIPAEALQRFQRDSVIQQYLAIIGGGEESVSYRAIAVDSIP